MGTRQPAHPATGTSIRPDPISCRKDTRSDSPISRAGTWNKLCSARFVSARLCNTASAVSGCPGSNRAGRDDTPGSESKPRAFPRPCPYSRIETPCSEKLGHPSNMSAIEHTGKTGGVTCTAHRAVGLVREHLALCYSICLGALPDPGSPHLFSRATMRFMSGSVIRWTPSMAVLAIFTIK